MIAANRILKIEFLLIALILFGVFIRFYNLDIPLHGDEVIYTVASTKMHQESFSAGRDYVMEHPPFGKWIVGLPSKFIEADYDQLKLLEKDVFVWAYMAYDSMEKNFVAFRMMEALLGVASIGMIFLISKQLFGTVAGLWSAVIASLSFEMIGYSRVVFMEMPMITFILLTLFIYLNYIKSAGGKRTLLMLLFFISLTATLLTRHIQPLFLMPIFLISQFFVNRANIKENIYFALLIGISYYLAFHVIFPQDILGYGQSRFGYSSPLGFLSFKMPVVIGHLIFRDSLLFTSTLIGTLYLIFQNAKRKIKLEISPVLLIFLGLSFLMFSFLSFPLPRHYVFMFIPIYIIGGYTITKLTSNKLLAYMFIILALVNIPVIIMHAPEFLTYTNFGVSIFQSMPHAYDQIEHVEDALDKIGDAKVLMTNDPNVLIFFSGNKTPIPPARQENCNNELMQQLDLNDTTILYVPHSKQFNFENDPYVCPLLKTDLENARIIEV